MRKFRAQGQGRLFILKISWRRILRINWRGLPPVTSARPLKPAASRPRASPVAWKVPRAVRQRSLLASATCSAAALAASKLSAVPLETRSGRAFFPLCL